MKTFRFLSAAALLSAAVSLAHAASPGNEDTSFASGPQADSTVLTIALQPNGQVLAGGIFANFRGAPRNLVARLNPDGSLDSFNPGLALTGYNNGAPAVNSLAVQTDGKIIVAGIFNVLGQTAGGGVARLNADGSLDATFNAGAGIVDDAGEVGRAYAVAALPGGKTLVGGAFVRFNGVSQAGLVRLNADGSLDGTFNPGGAGITANAYGGDVRAIAVQSDGRIVIGGHFSRYNGVAAGSVTRLNADGTPDTTFDVGTGADDAVFALAVQGDGRVLAGGGFNTFDGATITAHMVRLNTDGSLDTGYAPRLNLFIEEVDAIVLQPDGEAVIGGTFLAQGGLVNSPANGIARLNTDGSQDTRFDAGMSNQDDQALALALQPDGKLLAAIDFGAGYSFPSDVFRLFDVTPTPTVSIAPGVAQTNESSGSPATFVLTLSSASASDIYVAYKVKGTAGNGVDYKFLPGQIKIKAGKTSKPVKVVPYERDISGGGKVAVKLQLLDGDGYVVGTDSVAKVKIVQDQ